MTRVLLTDGDERATLAATRALGSQDIEVIVGAEGRHSLAGSSKYCAHSFVYPSPYRYPSQFVTCLLNVVRELHVNAVFPISDIAMHTIGPEKNTFERHARMPIPEYKVFESISDKYNLMRLALELHVPIPDTLFIPDGNIQPVLSRIAAFPVVVKPGCSLVKQENSWHKTAVQYANDMEQLERLYREHAYLKRPSLIQQRVVGDGCGVFALMNHGTPVAMFAHRRLREKPPSGGVSVLRESIPLNKTLVEPAVRLLRHVRWHGVAMVEYKVDHCTKTPVLMEVNGRLWGSLQLAIDAGVNFPWMLYQIAVEQAADMPAASYRCGVRSRWLLGDLDHLFMRLRKPSAALNLPPGAPSRWQSVRDFVSAFKRGTYNEVERWNDLGPFLYELKHYVRSS